MLFSACALNCPDICAYIVHVENGILTRLEGDPNHPYTLGRCCPKGYAHVLRMYSDDRILHPLKRTENQEFIKVSWSDALDEIASRLNHAKEKRGPTSVGIYSGSGNDGMAPKYAARYANAFGCRMIPGIAEICFEAAYEGARFNVGPFPPHELCDWSNSKCLVMWGTNKFESSIHSKRVIQEAIDKGAKLIVIDPRKTPYAKIADIYTTIRPGTDSALSLGIANEIITRDLYNHGFVEKYVVGFEEYRKRVSEYGKKKVSEITWVDVNTIEEIATTFATHGPGLIMTAPAGMNHYTNGTWAARAVHSLLAICGYLGVSGGGFQYLSSDHSPFNGASIRLDDNLDDSVKPIVPSGTYIPEFVLNSEDSPLEVLMIQAANPITQWANTNKVVEALEKIPFKVCIDLELTDTAKFCDYVLPATTIFEHHNLVHSELHRIVQYAPKIVEPRGEARDELWMWSELAQRTGLGDFFDISELDAIKMALDSEDCRDITLEKLIANPEGIRTRSMGIPFSDKKFRTESGKIELFSKQLELMGYDPLPFHEEPDESPLSTPDIYNEYSFIMISGRLRERLHSQFTSIEVGGSVRSFSHCTSCQKCVKECPDEAITLRSPSPEEIQYHDIEFPTSHSSMRATLGKLIDRLAVNLSGKPLEIPDGFTGLLIPEWDDKRCIGCRECALDVCPFDVVIDPIRQIPMNRFQKRRMYVRMHPKAAKEFGLVDGDRVDVKSIRGRINGIGLELDEDIDPRVVWSSDGWWVRDGNINLLTDDKHTAFGHTPGFNSVLAKIAKSKDNRSKY